MRETRCSPAGRRSTTCRRGVEHGHDDARAAGRPGTGYVVRDCQGRRGRRRWRDAETNNTLARSLTVGPDLVISAMTVPYNVRAGITVTASDTVMNQGADPAGITTTRFYLSTNVTLDAGDVPLDGMRPVGSLAAGVASTGTTVLTIPAGTAPGTYFVIGRADAGDAVIESTEGNNTAARAVQVAP